MQGVASAVTGVLVRPAGAVPHSDTRQPAGTQCNAEGDGDPAMLLSSLRAARQAQRKRKKERRRAAKQAAVVSVAPLSGTSLSAVPSSAEAVDMDVKAGLRSEPGGVSDAAPASAPPSCRSFSRLAASDEHLSVSETGSDALHFVQAFIRSTSPPRPFGTTHGGDNMSSSAAASAGRQRSPRRQTAAPKGRGRHSGRRDGKGAPDGPY